MGYISSKYSCLHFFLEQQFSLFDFLSMKAFFSFGPSLGIAIVKNKRSLCSSNTYSKQNFCITGNLLYLSNNSHHTVTFPVPEFSSSFSWELQNYEKEDRRKAIRAILHIVHSLNKIQISILDNFFEKFRKLQEPMLSKMWGNKYRLDKTLTLI